MNALEKYDLIGVMEKYFPRSDGWSWGLLINKTRRAWRYRGGHVQGRVFFQPKIVQLSTNLLESECVADTRQYILHTILHEYAHWVQWSATGKSDHDKDFFTILHDLEYDEKCLYKQYKVGVTLPMSSGVARG